MADEKISTLAAAGALTGTESVEAVQGGVNVKTTAQAIANLAAAGSGHVIEDEGTPLTQRANLNFVGGGVSAADAGGKTVVTIPAASAILASSISDSDTTHAPDGNSVFDALALKANLASPAFSGTPSLPTGTTGITQSASDNSTKLATTAYVDTSFAGVDTDIDFFKVSSLRALYNY